MSKYGNYKTIYKGLKFDSVRECEYYIILHEQEKKGEITDLKRQVKFTLQPAFELNGKKIREIAYFADFTYYDRDGKYHIIDVKGMKTEVYKLKKKMMQYKGHDIEEV